MTDAIEFVVARRTASPMLLAIAGVSGSGKTMTALLIAAGLAGPKGAISFIDTENGRGSMYADEPDIIKALPQGYKIAQLGAPFSPQRYILAVEAAESAGTNVLIIDQVTYEYEGIGGIEEIAEKNSVKGRPNWAMAKMLHKRFLNRCLLSNMDIIFCVRAREKTKPIKNAAGKEEYVSFGIQPIAEKNFMFEMTLSFMVDEQTHFASPIKVPKPLIGLFPDKKLLTKEDGERIRQWNHTGAVLDPTDQLKKRARAAAEEGVESYRVFFQALTKDQRKAIQHLHEDLKYEAEQADLARQKQAEQEKEMAV